MATCILEMEWHRISTPSGYMQPWTISPLGMCNPVIFLFCCKLWSGMWLLLSLQPALIVLRYYSPSLDRAVLVRPCWMKTGQKVFKFDWCSVSRKLVVSSPLDATIVCRLPGKFGPKTQFWKAGSWEQRSISFHKNICRDMFIYMNINRYI